MRNTSILQLLYERGEVYVGRLLFLANELHTEINLTFSVSKGDWKIYDT